MSRVRSGERDAFRVLVVRHAEKVAGFCARITGDRVGASEVAQEVWLVVWDTRGRWEPRSRFVSYLYTVAFTRARNHTRSRRRREAVIVSTDADIPASAKLSIDELLDKEQRERVFRALDELPAAMREALVMRFVDDLSYDEMERILSTQPSTLRSRVHHGLARLKARLLEEER